MPNAQDYVRQDRDFVYGRGNTLNQQEQDTRNNEGNVGEFYRRYGDEAYDPLIGGRGGYSADERDQITREGDLNGLLPTDEQLQSNQITDDERGAIRGNAGDRWNYYNPGDTTAITDEGATNQRGAAAGLRSGLYSAADRPGLNLSGDYSEGVDSTLNDSESRVRGDVDLDRLRQDPTYASRARMTPEQQQDIVTRAGITAGTAYQAAAGDVARQARAAGVDPAGEAAMKERLLREGSGAAADAATGARIGASNAAYQREKDIESGRRAGEVDASQIGSSTDLALSGQRLSAQDRLESQRLAAERDIATRNAQAASESGQAEIANERNITGQRQQANQYNQNTGIALATGIDQDTTAREQALATNRQNINLTNQNNQFARGAAVNTELSNRNKAIADKRLADAQEGRGYLQSQEQLASGNQNAAAGRQATLYGTEGGLAQGSTQTQAQQDNQPKWWEKAAGLAIGAAGAAAKFA